MNNKACVIGQSYNNTVLKTSEKPLKSNSARDILINAKEIESKGLVIQVPPIRPKGGEVFLYKTKKNISSDHLADQYAGKKSITSTDMQKV